MDLASISLLECMTQALRQMFSRSRQRQLRVSDRDLSRYVRGITVHLTEGNVKTQIKPIKSLLQGEVKDIPFAALGNPGEVKVDVAVPPVAGEEKQDNNNFTYLVAFQS